MGSVEVSAKAALHAEHQINFIAASLQAGGAGGSAAVLSRSADSNRPDADRAPVPERELARPRRVGLGMTHAGMDPNVAVSQPGTGSVSFFLLASMHVFHGARPAQSRRWLGLCRRRLWTLVVVLSGV
jgi:hypothetical protein